jgi:uncharacterized protein (DUF2141 family)
LYNVIFVNIIAGFVNMMMKYFCSLSFILCSFHLSAATLDVEIQGVTEGGVLHLAIYSWCTTWNEAGVVEKIGKGTYKGSFEIPPGTYAIGVYIDENENEKLDTNFFGIPKEQYGFSNNAKAFGIPKFEAASFVIDTYKKVQIGL